MSSTVTANHCAARSVNDTSGERLSAPRSASVSRRPTRVSAPDAARFDYRFTRRQFGARKNILPRRVAPRPRFTREHGGIDKSGVAHQNTVNGDALSFVHEDPVSAPHLVHVPPFGATVCELNANFVGLEECPKAVGGEKALLQACQQHARGEEQKHQDGERVEINVSATRQQVHYPEDRAQKNRPNDWNVDRCPPGA